MDRGINELNQKSYSLRVVILSIIITAVVVGIGVYTFMILKMQAGISEIVQNNTAFLEGRIND